MHFGGAGKVVEARPNKSINRAVKKLRFFPSGYFTR